MFVACSTRCFEREPLESALRHMVEMEFNKIDLAIVEGGPHLQPSEVAENFDNALRRVRQGPSLTVSALDLDFGAIDPATYRKRFEVVCRLARQLTVAVLTIPASPRDTAFETEVRRLSSLAEHANREGLVLTVLTHSETLAGDPATAVALCQAVPGLALTLDPSHFLIGPHQGGSFDEVFPHVQNVHFRDTGKTLDEFQVRVGQGKIDYARIVSLLQRHGYERGLTVSIHDRPDNPFDIEVEVRKLKLLLECLL